MKRTAALLLLVLAALVPVDKAGAGWDEHYTPWSPAWGIQYSVWVSHFDYGGVHFAATVPAFGGGTASETWSSPGLSAWFDPGQLVFYACEPDSNPFRWAYLAWASGNQQAGHNRVSDGGVLTWSSYNPSFARVSPWSGDPPAQCVANHLW